LILKNRLVCHTDTACASVHSLSVEIESLLNGNICLRYELTGDSARLRIPAPLPPGLADGLWRHTCFEAFIAVEGNEGYHEFNFSPSGKWAAYAFSGYRAQREWSAGQTPLIRFVRRGDRLLLDAVIAAADLPPNPSNKPLQLGLTAVIETVDGHCSYWALHHPSIHPDFHHRGGFVLPLKTAVRAG
jgi:hypothetical protein